MRPFALAAPLVLTLAGCGVNPFTPPTVTELASYDIITADPAAVVDDLVTNGRVVLRGFAFASGSAELSTQDRAALSRLGPALASPQALGLKVAVVGHTDSVGDFNANIALSERRAQAIADALVRDYGIERTRLAAVGVGPIAPVADNGTELGRAQNRRVELVVVD